jgi:hypothetical protein
MTDESTIRNRLISVAAQPVTTDSLVGSFFHADAERGWQGCVVAQPMPGVYLVELFGWGAADSPGQQVVRIDDMGEWTFYDTAEWMNRVYEHGAVKERWEREREQRRAEDRGRGARLLAGRGVRDRLTGIRPRSRIIRDPGGQPGGLGLVAAFSGQSSSIARGGAGARRPMVLHRHPIAGRGERPLIGGLLGLLVVVAIVLLLLKVAVLAGILALIVIVLLVLVLLGRRI